MTNCIVENILYTRSTIQHHNFFSISEERIEDAGSIIIVGCSFLNLNNCGSRSIFFLTCCSMVNFTECIFKNNFYQDEKSLLNSQKDQNEGYLITILKQNGDFTMNQCSFISNENGCLRINNKIDSCLISNCTFINNSQAQGKSSSAVCLSLNTESIITGCIFKKNHGKGNCSIFFYSTRYQISMFNCNINKCRSDLNGLLISDGSLTHIFLKELIFHKNYISTNHGEIEILTKGKLEIYSCIFSFIKIKENTSILLFNDDLSIYIKKCCFHASSKQYLNEENIYFRSNSQRITSLGKNIFNLIPNINLAKSDKISKNISCLRCNNHQKRSFLEHILGINEFYGKNKFSANSSPCEVSIVASKPFVENELTLDGAGCQSYHALIEEINSIPSVSISKCTYSNFGGDSVEYGCITIISGTTDVSIEGSTFINCNCFNSGSALSIHKSKSFKILKCNFNEIKSADTLIGCAVSCQGDAKQVHIELCTFDSCTTGCLRFEDFSQISKVINNTFSNCVTDSGSSNIYPGIYTSTDCTIEKCYFLANDGYQGSAIFCENTYITVNINRCTISDCISRTYSVFVASGNCDIYMNDCFAERNQIINTNNPERPVFYFRSGCNAYIQTCSFISHGSRSIGVDNGIIDFQVSKSCFSLIGNLPTFNAVHISGSTSMVVDIETKFSGELSDKYVTPIDKVTQDNFQTDLICKPDEPIMTTEMAFQSDVIVEMNCHGMGASTSFTIKADTSVINGISSNQECSYENYLAPNVVFIVEDFLDSIMIQYCNFNNNKGSGNQNTMGGSILYFKNGPRIGDLKILDCTFVDCGASSGSGGLFCINGNLNSALFSRLKVTNAKVSSNSEGNVLYFGNYNGNSIEINDIEFNKCRKDTKTEHLIYIYQHAIVKFVKCSFTDSASIYKHSNSLDTTVVSFDGCNFSSCTTGNGFSILDFSSPNNKITMTKCEFSGCGISSGSKSCIELSNASPCSVEIIETFFKEDLMSDITISQFYTIALQSCIFTKGSSVSSALIKTDSPSGEPLTIKSCCFSSTNAPNKKYISLNGFTINFDEDCCIDASKADSIDGIVVSNEEMFDCTRCIHEPLPEENLCYTIGESQKSINFKSKSFIGTSCTFFVNIRKSLDEIIIVDCMFSNYRGGTADYQGCITMSSQGSANKISINKTTFKNCAALNVGAALHLRGCSNGFILYRCQFLDCYLTDGTKLYGSAVNLHREISRIKVLKCVFDNCKSGGLAIGNNKNTVETIDGCTFKNCYTVKDIHYPGIMVEVGCEISNTTFYNNSGGYMSKIDLSIVDSSITFSNCIIKQCIAKSGGVIQTNSAGSTYLNIENCEIYQNEALDGVISVISHCSCTVSNTMFLSTGSTSIYVSATGSLDVQMSCFACDPNLINTEGIHINSQVSITIDDYTKFGGNGVTVVPSMSSSGNFIKNLECPYVPRSEEIIFLSSEKSEELIFTSTQELEKTYISSQMIIKGSSITRANEQDSSEKINRESYYMEITTFIKETKTNSLNSQKIDEHPADSSDAPDSQDQKTKKPFPPEAIIGAVVAIIVVIIIIIIVVVIRKLRKDISDVDEEELTNDTNGPENIFSTYPTITSSIDKPTTVLATATTNIELDDIFGSDSSDHVYYDAV